jgi:hypothetical protein
MKPIQQMHEMLKEIKSRHELIYNKHYKGGFNFQTNNDFLYKPLENELLKLQQRLTPIKPLFNGKEYICGSCQTTIEHNQNDALYCCMCGKPIEWEWLKDERLY